jgi:hypothetical protein
MKRGTKSAVEALNEMFARHRAQLAYYPYEREIDRWYELLVASLSQGVEVDVGLTRRAIRLLDDLQLSSVEALASIDNEQRSVLLSTFKQIGISDSQARQSIDVLVGLASSLLHLWQGHVQRLLRMFATAMTREVGMLFANTQLDKTHVNRVATLWLQNVLSLPVLLHDDPHVRQFRKKHNLTEAQLTDLADVSGVNLALLDDLLAMEHVSRKNGTAHRAHGEKDGKGRKNSTRATSRRNLP